MRNEYPRFNELQRDFYVADSREIKVNNYDLTTQMTNQIESSFTYHAPKDDQSERYVMIRDEAKKLAINACKNSPPSREQSLAITALENFVFWINAAIARNE